MLFALDQDEEGSPGYLLVEAVAKSHNVQLNFDQGTLDLVVPFDEAAPHAIQMVKMISSLVTCLPHIGTGKRHRDSLGPRVSSLIRQELLRLKLLRLVKRRVHVAGRRVSNWTVDYSYRPVGADADVLITTLDLDVQNPLHKANHAVGLAVDIGSQEPNSIIRLVYSRHTHGDVEPPSDQATEAAGYVQDYGERFGYVAYDYDEPSQREGFSELIWGELGPTDQAWRQFLTKR